MGNLAFYKGAVVVLQSAARSATNPQHKQEFVKAVQFAQKRVAQIERHTLKGKLWRS